ncbi:MULTISPECIES: signal peptidase I [Arthrobacter]|uniref:Signal peptidase I n=2 Tax=Arthrobacter TaxID=1663 RepID=A0ABU9KFC8_9MICC|nr:signal peptidase I [Arthrobacter sp. YJM1]MDP5225579.1 signal peptidase I [Arthrobacter sp. YJM1]
MKITERQSPAGGWRFAAPWRFLGIGRFLVFGMVLAVVLISCVRAFWVDVFYIPSASMEPLLQEGDRILVSRTAYQGHLPARGDLVVFDGRGSLSPADSGKGPVLDFFTSVGQWLGVIGQDTVYVKRVIGVPGDRVHCCTASGRLEVNGAAVHEPYLYPGDVAGDFAFTVQVPPGTLWLMGDHRSVSRDSRSLLGAPGGGMIPVGEVLGRPEEIVWPLDRLRQIPSPAAGR